MGRVSAHRMLLYRVLMLGVSLAACAWFALGQIQVHDEARATQLLSRPVTISGAQAAEIRRLLDRAGTLNPDRRIDILRAETDFHLGDRAAAEREVKRVVNDEPQNIEAWLVLDIAAYGRDSATERLAASKRQQLAPPVPAAP